MKTVLLCGGSLEDSFVLRAWEQIQPDYTIGIDRGLEFCYRNQIQPQYILGDFDSIDKKVLEYYQNRPEISVKRYQPKKDATDARLGMELALDLGSREIFLLGASGGRLDHYMANLQSLIFPLERGARAWILDSQNAITVLDKGIQLRKDRQFGRYVSFFSMGDRVEGLTLEGFQYGLSDYTLTNADGVAVSNEIEAGTARVEFRKGLLLLVMSRDREDRESR